MIEIPPYERQLKRFHPV